MIGDTQIAQGRDQVSRIGVPPEAMLLHILGDGRLERGDRRLDLEGLAWTDRPFRSNSIARQHLHRRSWSLNAKCCINLLCYPDLTFVCI